MNNILQIFRNMKKLFLALGVVILIVSVFFLYVILGKRQSKLASCSRTNCASGCCVEGKCQTQGTEIKGYSCLGANKWATPEGTVVNTVPEPVVNEVKLSTSVTNIPVETGISNVTGQQEQAKVAVPTGYTIVNLTEEEKQAFQEEIRNLGAVNPTQITAKSGSAADAVELESDQIYSYPNPVFSWDGAVVKESGVKIIGYQVYFGESHFSADFLNEAKFQGTNTYTANNLVKGKTYYLMVRVVTDSKNPNLIYGFDIQGEGRPARPIFTYNLQ